MKKYFDYTEVSNCGMQIGLNWEVWLAEGKLTGKGSYRIIPARILGVSYDQYLLWCQSKGARLIGKAIKYSGAIFDKPNPEVLDFLNKRANEIFSKISISDLKF